MSFITPLRQLPELRWNTAKCFLIFYVGLSIVSKSVLAQGTIRNLLLYEPDKNAYTVVEKPPKFPGGAEALGRYIQRNLHYPATAKVANVSGKVYVQFIVRKDGQITDIDILKGLGFGCDEEALQVVRQMPNWVPGRQSGQPVDVRYTLPISFSTK